MSAKELKAIADIGITLGYSGDELKQLVNDERMRMDKEKELERQRKEKEAEIQRNMGVDPWVDRGTCPPTFCSGGDALCFVPPTFRGLKFL